MLTICMMWVLALTARTFAQFPLVPDLASVSRDSLRTHITYLGSDRLAGRGTGSTGEQLAAEYLAGKLRRYGVQPVQRSQSYFQMIPMLGSTGLPDSELRIFHGQKVSDLVLGQDYLLMKTGPQTLVSQPSEIVFVGYGIVAPEFDYHDYQNINVAGKIVAFLDGEPVSDNPGYFNGANKTIHALPETKLRQAISRGAHGSILIPDADYARAEKWQALVREYAFEDVTLAYRPVSQFAVMLSPQAAEWLFGLTGVLLADVRQKTAAGVQESFPLNMRLSFRGEFIERSFRSPNVLGYLPGSDPQLREEFVLVSAHYDHLGVGMPMAGDSIYNGVFDNAAGVAAVLEIARIFSETPLSFRRSLLFVFLTGEEKGLLGSRFYVDHPVVPLYKTVANINIDGLAMFDTFDDVIGIGSEWTTLGNFMTQAARSQGLQVAPVNSAAEWLQAFDRSDQISFAQAGIPSVLTMEGLAYRNLSAAEGQALAQQWMAERYHTPFDDLYQSMNLEAARQHCQFAAALCATFANSDAVPEWLPEAPYRTVRLQTIAEKR